MMNLVTISARENGRLCPYCRTALHSGTTGAKCGACSAIHHEDCWAEGGGCAVFGCTNAAVANSPTLQEPPPIPPLGKAAAAMNDGEIIIKGKPQYSPPPHDRLPQNEPNSTTKALLMAAGVVTAALVATLIAVFVFSDSDSSGVIPEPTTTQPSTDDDESNMPSETDREASSRILEVLDEYTSAYSNEDNGGLSSIFTPNIQRWGVNGAQSCAHDIGRRAVLGAYRTQFDTNSASTYSLSPLRPSDIDRISETRARVSTIYSVGSSSGAISFSFERTDSAGWRISRVKVGNCV